MFRPGNLGHIGRLGLVAASRPGLVAQSLAILAKYGSAANLYLPGVGAISGITAGNWLDSIGTTAATVDGQVGLVVSAGKTRGGNLTPGGGTFDSSAGWFVSTGWTISGGIASFPVSDVAGRSIGVATGAVAGRWYAFRCSVTRLTGLWSFFAANTGDTGRTDSGIVTGTFRADSNGALLFFARAGFTGSIDDFTIQELPGIHLTQSTAANRPILRLAGGVYAWDFVSSDSFTSTMTPGNAGFFCASANVTDSGVLRTLLGAGAGSDASSGVWLARHVSSNLLMLQVGNGTTRNSIGAPYPVATTAVASAGWDASAMFVGINNTETSGAKTVDCTSSNTMNLGVLTGTTNPMLGTIGPTILMPTVLPTASERATLRQFVASLSGVAM